MLSEPQKAASSNPSSGDSLFEGGAFSPVDLPKELVLSRSLAQADLSCHPFLNNPPPPQTPSLPKELYVGDAHGNPILILYCLLYHGVVSLEITAYSRLYGLYNEPPHNNLQNIQNIIALLETVTAHPQASECKLVLIGDELADRGKNDFITLRFLKTLQEKGILFTVLLSNHSIEHILKAEHLHLGIYLAYMHRRTLADPETAGLTHSYLNFYTLIKESHLLSLEALNLYNSYYKPHLRLVEYLKLSDRHIVILTHACIGMRTLRKLPEELTRLSGLPCPFAEETIDELIASIDKINEVFTAFISQENWTFKLPRTLEGPLMELIWQRNQNQGDGTPLRAPFDEMALTPYPLNYRITHVHGHDGMGNTLPYMKTRIINLDGLLGKAHRENDKGLLPVATVELKEMTAAALARSRSRDTPSSPQEPSLLPPRPTEEFDE